MKKVFFIAILASLFICFGCNKTEQEQESVTPTTTPSTNNEVHPGDPNGPVSLRSCDGCGITQCCCKLTVLGPSSATVNVGFCSSVFSTVTTNPCFLGNGTCGSGTQVFEVTDNLQVGVMDEDFKEWCSGDTSVPFVITNYYGATVGYSLDCGGPNDPITFALDAGESAYIVKDANCNSTVDCKF